MSTTTTLREHYLAYCNATSTIATSATLSRNVNLEVLETIETCAPTDTYLSLQASAIHTHLAALQRGIGDTQAIQDLYNTYAETRTYLRLKALHPGVTPVPRQRGQQTPDFSISLPQETIYLEYKSLNMVGGTAAHNTQLGASLDANIALQAQTGRVRTAKTVHRPYHAAGFPYRPDSTRMVIETITRKIQGNLSPGQFSFGPTLLIVDLAELPLVSAPEDALNPTYTDPDTGHPISGELCHIAWGTTGTVVFRPYDGITHDDGLLETEGVLRSYSFVRGILFVIGDDWYGAIDGLAQSPHIVALVQSLAARTRTTP